MGKNSPGYWVAGERQGLCFRDAEPVGKGPLPGWGAAPVSAAPTPGFCALSAGATTAVAAGTRHLSRWWPTVPPPRSSPSKCLSNQM